MGSVERAEYYACRCRLEGQEGFFLWVSPGERDGPVSETPGAVPAFRTLAGLEGYAEAHAFSLEPGGPVFIDLDPVADWLAAPSAAVDCDALLTGWNLFDDVALSVGAEFEGADGAHTPLYDKLFWGCNLPMVTPPGEHYMPKWKAAEIESLARVLRAGLDLFRTHVRPA